MHLKFSLPVDNNLYLVYSNCKTRDPHAIDAYSLHIIHDTFQVHLVTSANISTHIDKSLDDMLTVGI